MLGISYMGTKQRLATVVASLISDCAEGGVLDLFAGMCSVGSAVAMCRPVWANDLQLFSCEVARAKFCSRDLPLSGYKAAALCRRQYDANLTVCLRLYKQRILREETALARGQVSALRTLLEEVVSIDRTAREPPHRYQLLARYFGGSYFGVSQSIEADSIRAAIDAALEAGDLTVDQHRWLLLSLCVALSRASTSTGHFAQPLTPKRRNLQKFRAQRKRSIWTEWLHAIELIMPVGARAWRARNRVFNSEATSLLIQLKTLRGRPRVIYADPPYTKDQYSRYYHLYETVLRYDYPGTSGRGQYRSDRAVSHFSLQTRVEGAFTDLISRSAAIGADLIVSYPTNGLMTDSRRRIPELMRASYGRSPDIHECAHAHSTMGASKGSHKSDVVEVFYRVKCND